MCCRGGDLGGKADFTEVWECDRLSEKRCKESTQADKFSDQLIKCVEQLSGSSVFALHIALMNQFFKLLLLAPSAFAPVLSVMMTASSVHANTDRWVPVTKDYSCTRIVNHPKRVACKRINANAAEPKVIIDLNNPSVKSLGTVNSAAQEPLDDPDSFEFTDEESDASVALFGCDCPACIRSLRNLLNAMS